jgi:hypothetical protein
MWCYCPLRLSQSSSQAGAVAAAGSRDHNRKKTKPPELKKSRNFKFRSGLVNPASRSFLSRDMISAEVTKGRISVGV